MTEEQITQILQAIPGSKRAAAGVIIEDPSTGQSFHIQGVISKAESEGLEAGEIAFLAFCSRSEIIRMRSIGSAHDHLLRMRAMALVDSPRAVRVMRHRRKAYESSGRPWSLSHYYHMFDFYHKSYIDALPRSEAKIVRAIPAGLLPIVDVNAACIASLSGEIVIASECLRYFCYFMTIAVLGGRWSIGMVDRVHALSIAYRIINQSEAFDFDIDSRGVLPSKVEAEIQSLVSDQLKFIYGHEYAHYLRGHVSGASVMLPGDRDAAKAFSHELEFDADAHSIKILSSKPALAKCVAYGGMCMFFFLDLLYKIKGTYGLPSFPVSETHPAPIDRIWALHTALGSKSPVSGLDIKRFLAACEQIEGLFNRCVMRSWRPDVLTFYGSVYLPGYTDKVRRDRFDF